MHARLAKLPTLMYALYWACLTQTLLRKLCIRRQRYSMNLSTLADDKGSSFWKALGIMQQGCILALKGEAMEADSK